MNYARMGCIAYSDTNTREVYALTVDGTKIFSQDEFSNYCKLNLRIARFVVWTVWIPAFLRTRKIRFAIDYVEKFHEVVNYHLEGV